MAIGVATQANMISTVFPEGLLVGRSSLIETGGAGRATEGGTPVIAGSFMRISLLVEDSGTGREGQFLHDAPRLVARRSRMSRMSGRRLRKDERVPQRRWIVGGRGALRQAAARPVSHRRSLHSGGSATGLSATGARIGSLPVMNSLYARFGHFTMRAAQ
jgi:hypothetical protein